MLRANWIGEGACYNSPKTATHIARECLHFSIRTLERALLIKNLEKLLKLSKRCDEISFSDDPKAQNEFRNLRKQMTGLMEHYTDNMIIVAAYENYLKAKLLIKGYLIHQIDRNWEEYKTLSNKQRRQPIRVCDIPEISRVNSVQHREDTKYQSLLDQTLKITTLLSPDYLKALELSDEVVFLLKRSVKERNKLHYLAVVLYRAGHKDFQDYRLLSEYLREKVNLMLLGTEIQPDKSLETDI